MRNEGGVEMRVCQNEFKATILNTHDFALSNSQNTKEITTDSNYAGLGMPTHHAVENLHTILSQPYT